MLNNNYDRSRMDLIAHILTQPGENPYLAHEADDPRIITEDSLWTKLKKKLRRKG